MINQRDLDDELRSLSDDPPMGLNIEADTELVNRGLIEFSHWSNPEKPQYGDSAAFFHITEKGMEYLQGIKFSTPIENFLGVIEETFGKDPDMTIDQLINRLHYLQSENHILGTETVPQNVIDWCNQLSKK